MDQQTRDAVHHLRELVLASSLDVAGAVIILIVGWLVAGWVQGLTRRALERARRMDPTLKPFIASTARYAVLVFVVVAVLAQFGVQTASIVAALGTIAWTRCSIMAAAAACCAAPTTARSSRSPIRSRVSKAASARTCSASAWTPPRKQCPRRLRAA